VSDAEGALDDTRSQGKSSIDPLVQLVSRALRCLNNPAALARAELADWIPATLDAATVDTLGRGSLDVSPLERAQAIRTILADAIERLRPPDSPYRVTGAVQYLILREEYLLGFLNKHIMARHDLSEGTFNRNRRDAVAVLAEDLYSRELLLSTATRPEGASGYWSNASDHRLQEEEARR
jgi:hypothetical protein